MADNIVFITGATGHIGFKTLVLALEAGYHVRAAIRSEAKKAEILSAPSIKTLNPGTKLSFVVVPDVTVEGAYDEAVKGTTHIIHLASPIVMKGEIKPENYQVELIDPAVKGTLSILKAAAKTTGIKRVIITSSVVAIVDAKWFFEEEAPASLVFNQDSRTPIPAGPYPTDFHAYNASKVAALAATDAFIRERKPDFEVVNINPSFVIGKHELVTDVKDITLGTNAAAFGVVLGDKLPYPVYGASVHVDDGTYIANSEGYPGAGTVWQDATRIVAENYPDAVAKGIFPNNGIQDTRRGQVDARKSEEVFGFNFLTFEDQVKSVASHYLELAGEKAA